MFRTICSRKEGVAIASRQLQKSMEIFSLRCSFFSFLLIAPLSVGRASSNGSDDRDERLRVTSPPSSAISSSSSYLTTGCRAVLEEKGGPSGEIETLKWRNGLTRLECQQKCAEENNNNDGKKCAAVIIDKDVGASGKRSGN